MGGVDDPPQGSLPSLMKIFKEIFGHCIAVPRPLTSVDARAQGAGLTPRPFSALRRFDECLVHL